MGRTRGEVKAGTKRKLLPRPPVPSKKDRPSRYAPDDEDTFDRSFFRNNHRVYSLSPACLEAYDVDDEKPELPDKKQEKEDGSDFMRFRKDVKAILREETRFVRGSMQSMCLVQWKPSYEPMESMKRQCPVLYKQYLERKSAEVVSIAEGLPGKGREVCDSIVFNVKVNNENQRLTYSQVRERFPDALIHFYMKNLDIIDMEDQRTPDHQGSPEL